MPKSMMSDPGTSPQEVLIMESKEILEQNRKVQSVTLLRYCNKLNDNVGPSSGYDQVFSAKHEVQLVRYCQHAVRLNYGFTPKEFRKFSFEYAIANNIDCPSKWHENKLAGVDWLEDFLERNKKIPVYNNTETNSLVPDLKLNKTNIEKFYNYFEKLVNENEFQPKNIYSVDETGIGLKESFRKFISLKTSKQIITTKENKTVSMCLAVNAVGETIPPVFVFPRKKFNGEEPSTSTDSQNKSGWLQETEFLQFIKHFAKYAKAGPDNKILLMLDNQNTKIKLPVIEFCKMNYITMLSFPPNTSEQLQPLDRKIFTSFKSYYNKACDGWITDNPGKKMGLSDVQHLAEVAVPQAATPKNILEGFLSTGIHPFNSNIFNELEIKSIPDLLTAPSEEITDFFMDTDDRIDISNFEPLNEDVPTNFQRMKTPSIPPSLGIIEPRRSARIKKKYLMEYFEIRAGIKTEPQAKKRKYNRTGIVKKTKT